MRRCRITFVSPPETNRNSQDFVIKQEFYCIKNKDTLTHKVEALKRSSVMKENNVHGRVRSSRHSVTFRQLFIIAKNQICDDTFSKQWKIICNLKLYPVFRKVFPYIDNLRKCEQIVCYITIIYCYIFFISVINNVDTVLRVCYIKHVECFVEQLCTTKKLIEANNQNSIYQIRSEHSRVVYPLSKWITTSPKKYLSKWFTHLNIL